MTLRIIEKISPSQMPNPALQPTVATPSTPSAFAVAFIFVAFVVLMLLVQLARYT